jgi:hypothetical protein
MKLLLLHLVGCLYYWQLKRSKSYKYTGGRLQNKQLKSVERDLEVSLDLRFYKTMYTFLSFRHTPRCIGITYWRPSAAASCVCAVLSHDAAFTTSESLRRKRSSDLLQSPFPGGLFLLLSPIGTHDHIKIFCCESLTCQNMVSSRSLEVKVKCSRYRPGVAQRVGRIIALLFHDRDTRRGWVISSTPRSHFTPRKDPVQEAGWAPGPVWTGGKSRPHRNSIPDLPDRSRPPYRLSYPVQSPSLERRDISLQKVFFSGCKCWIIASVLYRMKRNLHISCS